jgi:hypothetical protein
VTGARLTLPLVGLLVFTAVVPDTGERRSVGSDGCRIGSAAAFGSGIAGRSTAESVGPFTFVVGFVVGTDGALRPAPRRSEHVACAGGEPVLGAGEISLTREAGRRVVGDVGNHSTGYRPDISSWPAVAQALRRAGLDRPSGFTHEVALRRCPGRRAHSIVREDDFVCVFRGTDLLTVWKVDPGA